MFPLGHGELRHECKVQRPIFIEDLATCAGQGAYCRHDDVAAAEYFQVRVLF